MTNPPRDRRPGGRTRRRAMASEQPDASLAAAATTVPTAGDVGSYFNNYIRRIRGGDMGSLPAVGALIVLVVVFSIAENGFCSLGNFANLITQAAPSILLAMGLVFVLLLGEIDLSAGTTSGVGAATTAVLSAQRLALAGRGARRPDRRCGDRLLHRHHAGQGPGAVVRGHAGPLPGPCRASSSCIVNSAHTQGNLTLESNTLNNIENASMPVWLGWAMAAVVILGFLAEKLFNLASRRRRGLAIEPWRCWPPRSARWPS